MGKKAAKKGSGKRVAKEKDAKEEVGENTEPNQLERELEREKDRALVIDGEAWQDDELDDLKNVLQSNELQDDDENESDDSDDTSDHESKRNRNDANKEFDRLEERENKKQKVYSFANAMAKVFSTKSEKDSEVDPILSKTDKPFKELEEDRLARKLKAELRNQKRKRMERNRKSMDEYSSYPYEKRLRQVATRGVVKLFNEIKKHQDLIKAPEEKDGKKESSSLPLTKQKFLELLSAGNGANAQNENKAEQNAEKEWMKEDYAMNKGGRGVREWTKQEAKHQQEKEYEIEQEFEDIELEDENEF